MMVRTLNLSKALSQRLHQYTTPLNDTQYYENYDASIAKKRKVQSFCYHRSPIHHELKQIWEMCFRWNTRYYCLHQPVADRCTHKKSAVIYMMKYVCFLEDTYTLVVLLIFFWNRINAFWSCRKWNGTKRYLAAWPLINWFIFHWPFTSPMETSSACNVRLTSDDSFCYIWFCWEFCFAHIMLVF